MRISEAELIDLFLAEQARKAEEELILDDLVESIREAMKGGDEGEAFWRYNENQRL